MEGTVSLRCEDKKRGITGDIVIGIWYACSNEQDVLASAIVRDGMIEASYRFRYYRDDKAFDSLDEKHHYGTDPIPDSPAARQKIKASFDLLTDASTNFGYHSTWTFSGGTAKEAVDWLKSQPFAHTKEVSKEEAEAMGLEEEP